MNRKKARLVYSVIAIITAAVTLIVSAETGILREALFRECNVRYYSEKSDDHVHRVSIYNSSDTPFQILVNETFTPNKSLFDFTFASADPKVPISFVDLLRTSGSQSNLNGLNHLLVTLDTHYQQPSLVVIDDAMQAATNQKMAFLGHFKPVEKHARRLIECKGEAMAPGCNDEAELEKWERGLRMMTYTADSAWRSVTGLERSGDGTFCSKNNIFLSGVIPPHQREYLSFLFDPREVIDAKPIIHIGESRATEVKNRLDLERVTAWIAIRYYPIRTITFCFLALVFVLTVRFISKQSTKRLSRLELANAALASPADTSESVWNELYSRVRPYIVSDYRHACQVFGKSADHSPFELFDHIKNRLVIDYGLQKMPFPSERRLEERLHGYIREIAAA